MGGTISLKRKINYEFKVTTQKNIFYPGEDVRIKIYIKASKTLKSGNITFQITQQEYWEGKKVVGLLKNKKVLDKEQNTNIIYNNQFQFHELINNKNILEGFEISFSIQLPNYMLPSIEYSINERLAYIRTYLMVRINELNYETFSFLLIKKPTSPLPSPLKISALITNKLLSILKNKNGIIEASYPSNNFSFYTNIPLSIHIDNGKERVNSITTQLIRKISFLHAGKEVNNLSVKDILCSVESPVNNNIGDINLNLQVIEPESVFNKYINYTNEIIVPDKTQLIYLIPSIETNIIKVEYYVKITPHFNSLINFKKCELNLPLSISHRSINDNNLSNINMFEQEINQINGNPNIMDPNAYQIENDLPDFQSVMGVSDNNYYNKPQNQ
jgi:hypothetical protein